MSILIFLIFGFVVGLLARALLPGRQGMGLLMTTVLGVVGSFLGGLIGNFVSGEAFDRIHPAGLLGSLLGAIIVLGVASMMGRGRLSTR